jgi:hypothetical protein
MKVKRENKIFILINLALLFITQPGAIVWANFDAPYGFMKDLTSWLGSFIGLSPFALAYQVYKREYFGKKAIYAYAAFILILAYVIYAVQQPLYEGFRAPGYKPAFPAFLAVCFLGGVLSLMLLPIALISVREVYLGYGYDIPLGVVEVVILLLILFLLWKLRGEAS